MKMTQRYDLSQHEGDWAVMEPCPDGEYVDYEAFVELEKQIESLKDIATKAVLAQIEERESISSRVEYSFMESQLSEIKLKNQQLTAVLESLVNTDISGASDSVVPYILKALQHQATVALEKGKV